jgi:hypothetical protein
MEFDLGPGRELRALATMAVADCRGPLEKHPG